MSDIDRLSSDGSRGAQLSVRAAWIVTGAALLTLLAAYRVGTNGLVYQEVLYFTIFVSALGLLLIGSVEVALVVWMLLFVIGIRQFYVTPRLPLHPLVLVITLAFALLVLVEGIIRRKKIAVSLPVLLYIFSGFWFVGLVTGIARRTPWDVMLVEIINFVAAFPIFIITSYTLQQNPKFWKMITRTLIVAGSTIAVLGLIEYYFPDSPLRLLPGFSQGPTTYIASGGFRRLAFRFFGSPEASFICALTLPISLTSFGWGNKRVLRGGAVFTAVTLQVLVIYLGGYRSLWLITSVAVIVVLLLRHRGKGLLITLVLVAALFFIFPQVGRARLGLTFNPSGPDSSTVERSERVSNALETAMRHPFGIGWAGSGWVHSDFAQVAANLGILAGGIFLLWYIKSLTIAFKIQLHTQDVLLTGLISSFIVAGGLLLTQGVEVRSYLMLPVWFVWALVTVRVRELTSAEARLTGMN